MSPNGREGSCSGAELIGNRGKANSTHPLPLESSLSIGIISIGKLMVVLGEYIEEEETTRVRKSTMRNIHWKELGSCMGY